MKLDCDGLMMVPWLLLSFPFSFMLDRYVTDILKMCMKKFNAEKYVLTNLQDFNLHFAGGIL